MIDRWEYKSVSINTSGWVKRGLVVPEEIEALLNEFGEEGWEAVSSTPISDGSVGTSSILILLKRRK